MIACPNIQIKYQRVDNKIEFTIIDQPANDSFEVVQNLSSFLPSKIKSHQHLGPLDYVQKLHPII